MSYIKFACSSVNRYLLEKQGVEIYAFIYNFKQDWISKTSASRMHWIYASLELLCIATSVYRLI